MAQFALEVLRARKGDCLILHYGGPDEDHLIMIDGGPAKVYAPHLKPRIAEIRKQRGLAEDEPLPVEILMVSHIDDDHIAGIIDLTRELRDLKDDNQPLPIRVRSLWHNSFKDVIGSPPDEFKPGGAWGPASLGEKIVALSEDEDSLHAHTMALIVAGVGQGMRLSDDASYLKWPVNRQFNGGLVRGDHGDARFEFEGGLTLTVVGPALQELEELWREHQKYLEAKARNDAKEQARAAAYIDESAANLSSLVVLAESGGRTILLTGDARGDKVIEGLRAAGLLGPGADDSLHVDILKVPHHGSDNNLETGFFKAITADHYVFTGDGEHGNPERASFQMLLDARPDAAFTLHLAYPVEDIDRERKKTWDEAQAAKRKKGKPTVEWSDARQNLGVLFAAEAIPGPKRKLSIVNEANAHLIAP